MDIHGIIIVQIYTLHIKTVDIYLYDKGDVIMPSPKDTHGPIVKPGPTAGNERTRNKNGQWRRKRNDAGISRKK